MRSGRHSYPSKKKHKESLALSMRCTMASFGTFCHKTWLLMDLIELIEPTELLESIEATNE